MNQSIEALRAKYLNFDEEGEASGFDPIVLDRVGYDLHSELVELFEFGRFGTNNEKVAKRLEQALREEHLLFETKESLPFYQFDIILKDNN